MATPKKFQLPKSVLEMKFMKKTKERLEKELQNTHGHEDLYSDIITKEMRQASGNYISESSFIFCEDLIEGRVSFKGMNPEIERLMDAENKANNCEVDMEKDVSDEILANTMSRLNKRKQLTSSKHSATKKRKR